MRREILIEGKPYAYDYGRDQERDIITSNGFNHSVRYTRLPDGRRLCLVDGRVIEIHGANGSAQRLVRSGWKLRQLDVVDPRRRRGASASAGGIGARAELVAPMPGKVVSVLRGLGESVEAGQGVVVLEAMKMENELRSPIAGVVSVLEVEPGQSMESGQLIAVVEPQEED